MERKKIDRNDIEAVIKGDKDITQFLEIHPGEGIMSAFGVRTSSNPNYLLRAMYEMYERSLNRKLAVQMMRKLYRSVGLGATGLNMFLKKQGLELKPHEFLMFAFKLQHQQGWGAPLELVSQGGDKIVVKTKYTFESDVMKDWAMPVCGVHVGWMEGVLAAVTGKNWVGEEVTCHAAGGGACEFVFTQRDVSWNERAEGIRKGERSLTEFLELKPLEGKITLIEEPVIMVPRMLFNSMMGSMSKIVGEAAAGGVINYRAYMELGTQNIAFFKKMGIHDPNTLIDMALAFYGQMGWFKVIKMDWNEAKKEKIIILDNSAEAESLGKKDKPSCHCTSGLLAGIVSSAFNVRVQGKEIKCKSKGDQYCEFTVTNKTE
ncbi:MAG: 4-vinyl reductase [Methanomicrobiales archaeon]|nr:4-vinyl reductase [Methanomicrobiales archaeon]